MTGLRVFLLSGLLIVSLLAAAAVMLIRAPVEADLTERVDRQLAEAGQSWASAQVEGQTAVLAGTAPTLEAQRLANAAASSVWGVRAVVDASAILPLKANYVFAATRARANRARPRKSTGWPRASCVRSSTATPGKSRPMSAFRRRRMSSDGT